MLEALQQLYLVVDSCDLLGQHQSLCHDFHCAHLSCNLVLDLADLAESPVAKDLTDYILVL